MTVHLRMEAASTRMEIWDDGIGFDPTAIHDRGGMGLLGMQERAHRLGAELRIDSAPGIGTRLAVEMPAEGLEVSP
ncbi:MAG TPA: ATP-binding protein [Chloroflexota bacterium]|nr:ATP-binding protein [Chloroflexota bacterium]